MSKSSSKSALVVVDMLTAYDFEDADRLSESVAEALPNMAALVEKAREGDVHLVYVNDNYGTWNRGRPEIVESAMEGKHPELVEPILPSEDDDFIVKARHTVFYETPLDYLLRQNEVEEVILVGQVTEQCIIYSALDAYVRHFAVHVPPDAVAHIHPDLAKAALKMMEINMDADLTPAAELLG